MASPSFWGLVYIRVVFRRTFWIHLVVLHFLAAKKKFINLIPLSPRKKEIELFKEKAWNLLFWPEFQRNRSSRRILISSILLFYYGILQDLWSLRILSGKAVDFAKQMVNVTVDRRALMRKSLLRITRVSSCSADLLPTTIMDNQFSLFSSYHLLFIIELLITWFHKFPIPNSDFHMSILTNQKFASSASPRNF